MHKCTIFAKRSDDGLRLGNKNKQAILRCSQLALSLSIIYITLKGN